MRLLLLEVFIGFLNERMDLLSYAIILGKGFSIALGKKKLNHLIAETCKRFPENKYEIEKHITFKSNIIAAFYNN